MEEKDGLGNIKSDEPDRSSVLGTAKSYLENSPSIPAQYLVTFKVSGPAAVLEEDTQHRCLPQQVSDGVVPQDIQAQGDSQDQGEGCKAQRVSGSSDEDVQGGKPGGKVIENEEENLPLPEEAAQVLGKPVHQETVAKVQKGEKFSETEQKAADIVDGHRSPNQHHCPQVA